MHESGGSADLPHEKVPALIGFYQLGSYYLEGHNPVHGLVDGLKHPAHAALTQLIENSVLTQLETPSSAGEQHLSLKLRDQAAGHHVASNHSTTIRIG
jgi:hypothetical protein